MGNPIFGVNISGIIKSAMASGLPKGKLIKMVPGSRVDGDLTAGQKLTPRAYTIRGFIDEYKMHEVRAIGATKKILIIGDTLPKGIIPVKDDRIEMEKVVHVVVDFERDPAAATYTCHVRSA